MKSLKQKILVAKVVQHLKNKPKDHNRKIHDIASGLIFIIAIYTFAGATYKDLAEASVITVENHSLKGWVVREEVVEKPIPQTDELSDKGVEKLLIAICTVESNCNPTRIGDGGKSYGAFQIYLPAHPNVTKEQAMDFEWSKKWTLEHGKKYLSDPAMFAKNHNGIGKTTNQWYVDKVMNVYKNL